MSRSPLIRQAAADVEAARGTAIQAGLHPNPHVGYQADDINTGSTAGYQGVGISQTISTGGKLKLARNAACMDLENARLTLSRTQYDLATQVRSNYFAVLVALERFRVNPRCRNSPRPSIGADQPGGGQPGGPLRTVPGARAGHAGADTTDPVATRL